MARTYTDTFLRTLYEAERNGLGYDLARSCVEANLPSKYVAVVFDVTPLTVFKWFRGAAIKPERHELIRAFIRLVKQDMEKGDLPAKSLAHAKAYLYEMVGKGA